MDEEMKLEFKKQHIETYKNAVRENILNNTNVLVDEDIMSLLKKPPLDSMDFIKCKFLDLAKKNKIVLNTEELSKILDNYRKMINEEEYDENLLGELMVYNDICKQPNRKGCALIPVRAIDKVLEVFGYGNK